MTTAGLVSLSLTLNDEERFRALLNLHIAEYQALTSRLTYWITLQYAIYSIAAIYLSYVLSAWNKDTQLVLGLGNILVLLLLAWAWLQTLFDIFNIALYIETKLKGRLKLVGGASTFWTWELQAAESKTKGRLQIFEAKYALSGFFVGIVIVLILLVRQSARSIVWHWGQHWTLLVLAVLIVYAAFMTGIKGFHAFRLQEKLLSAAQSSRENADIAPQAPSTAKV